MMRILIIGADEETSRHLEAMLREGGRFALVRSERHYPAGVELERLLRAHAPHAVFVCIDRLPEALAAHAGVEETVPGVPVVVFGRRTDPRVLMDLMRAGVREVLPMPFETHSLLELADRLEDHLRKNPLKFQSTDLLFTFLPAKPGAGTSTLALNLSVAFANQPDTSVLLCDFDLNSGLIAFLLKLTAPFSILDAVTRVDELDEHLWPQLVSTAGKLDVLPAGQREPGVRIQSLQISRMLAFARRQYEVICADLSGNMEKYSIDLMMESKRIFLVVTPEIPPLHLARERLHFLRSIDLLDRVSVLMNRWQKKSPVTVAQVEDLLEAPVYETFSNNYPAVHEAAVGGRPVAPDSELGRQVEACARRILDPGVKVEKPRSRRFLEAIPLIESWYHEKS